MDAKLDTTSFNSNIENKEEEKEVPKFYAFLPIIPLLIILVFSPLTGSSIKIGVVEAMFMSITLSMIIEGIRRKAFKSTLTELKIIFNAMGNQFANVITLIVAGARAAKAKKGAFPEPINIDDTTMIAVITKIIG